MKRGRLSNHEQKFIKDNAPYMSYLEIATQLDRDAATVQNYIETKCGLETNLAVGAQKAAPALRSRAFWPLLRKQFSKEEQVYIEEEWEKVYRQFKEDVTSTEEMQIIDMLKLDVMMHRMLIKKEQDRIEIENLRAEIKRLKKDFDNNKVEIKILEGELSVLINAQNVGVRDYRDLQAEKNKILKEMKATRDQRYSRVEASSESIKAWMAELINNENKRAELGRHLEKIRLASLDEEIRLAAYHKYENGQPDQPLLTPETVKDDND